MPIDNCSYSLASLLPPPSADDVTPVAAWPTERVFERHLLDLSLLPVSASRSVPACREAERIYDLASPTKRLLDGSEPYPEGFTLRGRVATIAAAVLYGHLPVEHGRRLLVPSEPSWLTSLNTPWQVRLAHDTLQTLAHVVTSRTDGAVTDAAKSLFLQLLEVEGNSQSRVLLSMNLFHRHPSLPRIDLEKIRLASRVGDLMGWMQFTPDEIDLALDVPRKQVSQQSRSATQPAWPDPV
jgi:hypothetical protein